MATTLFTNAVTLSDAGWFNDVDTAVYALTAVAGTDTITATGPNSLTSYGTGKIIKFIPAATNTGATTINISSLGAKNVFYSGAACVGGELKINVPVQIYYDGTQFNILGANTIYTPSSTTSEDLVSYVHPTLVTGHRDVIKAAYVPAWLNQQWGGGVNGYELVDAATGTPYKFESATGYLETNGTIAGAVGAAAANTWAAQGFKVSKSDSYSQFIVWMFKTANPTNNLQFYILPDDGSGTKPTGSTPVTNGTATALSGKLFESGDSAGQPYLITFPTPVALTAGTQYQLACKSSGAVDAVNYWNIVGQTSKKYPHGNHSVGDATPTWTATTTTAWKFLVVAPATTATFQSGGIFGDGKAVFYEGSPLNQSNQRLADLADLKGLTPNNMTMLLRGTAHTKDKTIADMTYGLDHDRVVVRCNVTTGYPSVTVYDSAGTASTVTGTTDISSGDHDVAVLVTTAGCSLWVDGASQGTPIVTTITFDTLFAQGQIGSLWIGGGFALAPTWSGSSISSFTGLPSTLGWTWTGTGTEANCMSVSGNKLYKNKSGYASTDTGYYTKATAGFTNATGESLVSKQREVSNTANLTNASLLQINDGSKTYYVRSFEYGVDLGQNGGSFSGYPQADFKTADTVFNLCLKGSDAYLWANGKLLHDGYGLDTGAFATNSLIIGDNGANAGENSDGIYSYWKYTIAGPMLPQATAGSLSEWAIWTGDKTSILATLWNSGSPISVKQFCGLGVNWKRGDDGAWVHRVVQRGITVTPSLSTSTTLLKEMEGFVIGDTTEFGYNDAQLNNTAGAGHWNYYYLDGALMTPYSFSLAQIAGYSLNITTPKLPFKSYFGVHKAEGRVVIGSGVGTSRDTSRSFIAEGRS